MKHKEKVYVSLPITGRPIEEAREQANAVRSSLKKLGYDVVTPFDVVEEPQGTTEREQYAYCMGRDIEALLQCNQILMCPGWRNSKGCQAEHAIAEVYGLTISYLSSIHSQL